MAGCFGGRSKYTRGCVRAEVVRGGLYCQRKREGRGQGQRELLIFEKSSSSLCTRRSVRHSRLSVLEELALTMTELLC